MNGNLLGQRHVNGNLLGQRHVNGNLLGQRHVNELMIKFHYLLKLDIRVQTTKTKCQPTSNFFGSVTSSSVFIFPKIFHYHFF